MPILIMVNIFKKNGAKGIFRLLPPTGWIFFLSALQMVVLTRFTTLREKLYKETTTISKNSAWFPPRSIYHERIIRIATQLLYYNTNGIDVFTLFIYSTICFLRFRWYEARSTCQHNINNYCYCTDLNHGRWNYRRRTRRAIGEQGVECSTLIITIPLVCESPIVFEYFVALWV